MLKKHTRSIIFIDYTSGDDSGTLYLNWVNTMAAKAFAHMLLVGARVDFSVWKRSHVTPFD